MIKINLLPPEFAAAQRKKEQQILAGGVSAIVVLVMVVFYGLKKSHASHLADEIVKAEANYARYQTIIAELEQTERDKQRKAEKLNVIKELNRSRLIYPVFFEDFLPIIPSDIWILNMQFTEQGGSIKVSMNNNGTSNFAVATLLTNLQQSPHFNGVELGPIGYTQREEGRTTISFTLGFTYRHQGPFPLSEFN